MWGEMRWLSVISSREQARTRGTAEPCQSLNVELILRGDA